MSQIQRKVDRLIAINGSDIPIVGSMEGKSAELLKEIYFSSGGDVSLIDSNASLLERQFQALKELNDLLANPIVRIGASIRERIYLEVAAYNDGVGITVDRDDGSTSINERIIREFNAFELLSVPQDFATHYKLNGDDFFTPNSTLIGGAVCPDAIGSLYNGVDEFEDIDADSSKYYGAETGFTFHAWIDTTLNSGFQTLLGHGNSSASANGFTIRINGDKIRLTSDNISKDSTNPIPHGKLIPIAITYDGLNIRFRINGVIDPSVNTLVFNTITGASATKLGADTPGFAQFFNGKLDDCYFYQRVLSEVELTALDNNRCDTDPNILNARVWYEARDESTITINLGNVSNWADKTINVDDSKENTAANQPNYVNNEVLITGTRSLRTDDNVDLTDDFCIFEFKSYTDITEALNAIATGDGSYIRKETIGEEVADWAASSSDSTAPVSVNDIFKMSAQNLDTGVDGNFWSNGDKFNQFGDLVNTRTTPSFLKLDNSGHVSATIYKQIIIFDRFLTNAEMQILFGYAAWRDGSQGLLAVGNPFLLVPPLRNTNYATDANGILIDGDGLPIIIV